MSVGTEINKTPQLVRSNNYLVIKAIERKNLDNYVVGEQGQSYYYEVPSGKKKINFSFFGQTIFWKNFNYNLVLYIYIHSFLKDLIIIWYVNWSVSAMSFHSLCSRSKNIGLFQTVSIRLFHSFSKVWQGQRICMVLIKPLSPSLHLHFLLFFVWNLLCWCLYNPSI